MKPYLTESHDNSSNTADLISSTCLITLEASEVVKQDYWMIKYLGVYTYMHICINLAINYLIYPFNIIIKKYQS